MFRLVLVIASGLFLATRSFAQIPGDYNGDEVVNLPDFVALESCMAGPAVAVAPGCETFDPMGSGHVGMSSAIGTSLIFAILPQTCANVASYPGAPHVYDTRRYRGVAYGGDAFVSTNHTVILCEQGISSTTPTFSMRLMSCDLNLALGDPRLEWFIQTGIVTYRSWLPQGNVQPPPSPLISESVYTEVFQEASGGGFIYDGRLWNYPIHADPRLFIGAYVLDTGGGVELQWGDGLLNEYYDASITAALNPANTVWLGGEAKHFGTRIAGTVGSPCTFSDCQLYIDIGYPLGLVVGDCEEDVSLPFFNQQRVIDPDRLLIWDYR